MLTVTAPGKVILFGEHAAVYGEPTLAVAVNLRSRISLEESERFTVNDYPMTVRHHSYIKRAIETIWDDKPLRIKTHSGMPSAAGIGSSSALTVAIVAGLLSSRDEFAEESVAHNAFEVEYAVQGSASPTDTTASTHGSGVFVTSKPHAHLLWSIKKDEQVWYSHHCDVPDMSFVIGYSGIKSRTGDMLAKVKRFRDHSGFARDVIEEIGKLTLAGVDAIADEDFKTLGKLMSKNHELLTILGLNKPRLQRLIDVSRKHSYGAKLTGAGGGGSVLILTDEPEEIAKLLAPMCEPYIVEVSRVGVRVE